MSDHLSIGIHEDFLSRLPRYESWLFFRRGYFQRAGLPHGVLLFLAPALCLCTLIDVESMLVFQNQVQLEEPKKY